jgi:hypothetical protein
MTLDAAKCIRLVKPLICTYYNSHSYQFIFILASISVWKSGSSLNSSPATNSISLALLFEKTHARRAARQTRQGNKTYRQRHPPNYTPNPCPLEYHYASASPRPASPASTRPRAQPASRFRATRAPPAQPCVATCAS